MARQPTRQAETESPDDLYNQQALTRVLGAQPRATPPTLPSMPGYQTPSNRPEPIARTGLSGRTPSAPSDTGMGTNVDDLVRSPSTPDVRSITGGNGGVTGGGPARRARDAYAAQGGPVGGTASGGLTPTSGGDAGIGEGTTTLPAGPLKPRTDGAGVISGAASGAAPRQPFASEGFDAAKHGKDDPKYVFQAIAEKYDMNDPAQKMAALQELRAHPSGFFTNADLQGDILTVNSQNPIYNGIGQFDIQRDTENGGPLTWQPVGQGGGAASGTKPFDTGGYAGMGPASTRTTGMLNGLSQGSTYDSLLARLQGILGPEAVDQQALQQILAQQGG